jgi:(p)ppGpp synthase/HD superfamily hydrolase
MNKIHSPPLILLPQTNISLTPKNMKIYTPQINKAINIAATHHDGQGRKVGGLPYIVHPFAVALILMEYTDDEDTIIAGILHDTAEDTEYSEEDIEKDFSKRIKDIVHHVTEQDKKDPWQKRKDDYLALLKEGPYESRLVCAADKIHNLQSMTAAYRKFGEKIAKEFNAPIEKKLWFYIECFKICKADEKMPEQILNELKIELDELERIKKVLFMASNPAKIIEYRNYDKNVTLTCPACSWSDIADNGVMETFNDLFHIECPECEKMLLIVKYPLANGLQG